MSAARLNDAWLAQLRRQPETAPAGLQLPAYDRTACGVGIVHLGAGAFHKAHQAVYTDDALARQGGDWRILGISLRGTAAADALNPQDGLYTLLVRDGDGTRPRVVGSLAGVTAASREPGAACGALADPAVRVVTLTVTEKAYGVSRADGRVLPAHAAIAHDLAHPDQPTGVLGLLVQAIGQRRARGLPAFTVLCCDNLPENGHLLASGVCDLAERLQPGLGDWISAHVAFPCSMVDRITPATTDRTLADAAAATGREDRAAVETEPFSMWVIEDRFPQGRPVWDEAGALMTDDVAPYERLKLRMLNGAHSLIAYSGHVAGIALVRDAMADAALAGRVRAHLRAAAATLQPLPGLHRTDYATSVCRRFSNPAVAHETYQIAMDGTEKLPQRILAPASEALAQGADTRPFAFAVAAWMRYCQGVTDAGNRYALRDPRADEIAACVAQAGPSAAALSAGLMALPGLFPANLSASEAWCGQVSAALQHMLQQGMRAALQAA